MTHFRQFVFKFDITLNMVCFVLTREGMEGGSSIPTGGQDTSSTPNTSPTLGRINTNPKKPLLKFVRKITKDKKKNSRGCEEWMCTLCDHVFKGSYTRAWYHLLSISGDGVKGFSCNLEKMMELTKLHMASL